MHWRGLTITRERAAQVGGLLVLLWWPLHLSGYRLVLVPLPLFVGLYLLRTNRVAVSAGPGWVPAVFAGVLVLVVTFRARSRIDSYGGI